MADMEDDESRTATFETLKVDEWLITQLKNMGIKRPSPIQYHCIPQILKGRDCIGCAKTGSGKTFAFALPILQELSADPYGIFALILTPTRELACQITDQFRVLGKPIGLNVCLIIGGMGMVPQALELSNKPHVLVATPGRLVDHLGNTGTLSLRRVRFLVLDEADRLLGGHFTDQLKSIFSALPKKRQTLLFSATITEALSKLHEVTINRPFFWDAPADVATVAQLDQRYVLAPNDFKDVYLVNFVYNFIQETERTSVVVFTDTCRSCQVIAMMLQQLGFECAALHSMIAQKERIASLASFKSSLIRVLIATDVASRGLDIPTVDMVINHNVPRVPKDYIHRVGRTARAGRGGRAITFVTQYDIFLLHAIEELIKIKLQPCKVDEKEVLKILTQVSVAKRESEVKLDESGFDEKKEIYRRKRLIMEGKDPDEEDRKLEKLKKKKRKKRLEEQERRNQLVAT